MLSVPLPGVRTTVAASPGLLCAKTRSAGLLVRYGLMLCDRCLNLRAITLGVALSLAGLSFVGPTWAGVGTFVEISMPTSERSDEVRLRVPNSRYQFFHARLTISKFECAAATFYEVDFAAWNGATTECPVRNGVGVAPPTAWTVEPLVGSRTVDDPSLYRFYYTANGEYRWDIPNTDGVCEGCTVELAAPYATNDVVVRFRTTEGDGTYTGQFWASSVLQFMGGSDWTGNMNVPFWTPWSGQYWVKAGVVYFRQPTTACTVAATEIDVGPLAPGESTHVKGNRIHISCDMPGVSKTVVVSGTGTNGGWATMDTPMAYSELGVECYGVIGTCTHPQDAFAIEAKVTAKDIAGVFTHAYVVTVIWP